MPDVRRFKCVIDVKERRPACVLIQAALGGNSAIVKEFLPVESWLLAPNDNMFLVEGSKEEWKQFSQELKKRFPIGVRVPPPAPPRRRVSR
jgi:hypothetical protein